MSAATPNTMDVKDFFVVVVVVVLKNNILKNSTATSRSTNSVPVSLDNPQNTLSTVFTKTISLVKLSFSIKMVHSDVRCFCNFVKLTP